MASSNAANMSKAQQYSQRRFGESNPRTLVGLHKTEVQLKKMIDTLEHQQNTAVNNIANHQQAMKMSWRRLEERRSTSPHMTRADKKAQQAKGGKGMLLQSNTRLYVEKTPDIYETGGRPSTVDDSSLGRPTSGPRMQGHVFHAKPPRGGPPPTQLTRAHTSPYISSPLNFRKKSAPSRPQGDDEKSEDSGSDSQLSDTKLSDSQDLSSSQPVLIKSSAMNSKETLLKASTLMDMSSISTGSAGFKGFYSGRPRSQNQRAAAATPLSPLMMSQQLPGDEDENTETEDDDVPASSLAEQFEQIKNCKYIRHSPHYNPEHAAKDDY